MDSSMPTTPVTFPCVLCIAGDPGEASCARQRVRAVQGTGRGRLQEPEGAPHGPPQR